MAEEKPGLTPALNERVGLLTLAPSWVNRLEQRLTTKGEWSPAP